jgi:cobalt/nickel transport protein
VSRRVVVPALLVAGVLALVGMSLLLGGSSEFTGTDNQAVAAIQEQDPGYEPWFASVLPPLSPSVESGLFAAQAAIGGGILGYVLGRLRGRHSARASAPPANQP